MSDLEIHKNNRGIQQKTLVLFDGVCRLCNNFIAFYDPISTNDSIRYIPLSSPEAKELLGKHSVSHSLDTVVVIENGAAYVRSKAFFTLMRQSKWPWKLVSLFQFLPVNITDVIYKWIAKHRYSIFGKVDQCIINQLPERKK